jgi:hypothetical protein
MTEKGSAPFFKCGWVELLFERRYNGDMKTTPSPLRGTPPWQGESFFVSFFVIVPKVGVSHLIESVLYWVSFLRFIALEATSRYCQKRRR